MANRFAPVRGGVAVVAVVVLALIAAACGSSSSSSSSSNAAAGSASSAASSASSSVSVQGGSASSFCAGAKQAGLALRKEIQGIAAAATSEPSKVKSELDATLSTLNGIQGAAPSDIKGDIGVFIDYMKQLQTVLAKHNYSVVASVSDLQKLQASEGKLNAASDRLQAWGKANGCTH